MNLNKLAESRYKYFGKLDGNQYIASVYALKTILRLIVNFKSKSILELGLGIGSISDTVLTYSEMKNKNIRYVGTEANEFCLDALKKYVKNYSKIELHHSISQINNSNKFDFIIVDGSDDGLNSIKDYCKNRTILFIEGFRGSQVSIIKTIFPNYLHVEIISKERNPKEGPFLSENWSGGGQLIFTNPNLYQKMYWFSEKVKSFAKRRIRKFI